MKIIQMKAENIKNLKLVEIKPEGNTVTLTGANGAGKSSVLDAIFVALTGKKLDEPVRRGEEKAVVEVDLGDYKVRRVFTENGSRVEVLNGEGLKFSSPQMLLNRILGKLSFDPLAFQRMTAKEQRKLMMDLAGLDFSDMDEARRDLYDQRTFASRDHRDLEGSLSQMDVPGDDVPDKEESFSDAIADIRALEEKREAWIQSNRERDGLEARIDQARTDIDESEKLIADSERTIAMLREAIEIRVDFKTKLSKDLSDFLMPEEVSMADISASRDVAEHIEDVNAKIRLANHYRVTKVKVTDALAEVDRLSKSIVAIDDEKAESVKYSTYPVQGLSVDDSSVLFNDLPFGQASTGQQIRISTAIAMALNPTLRVIFIRDGSLLDKHALAWITEAAKDKDYQVWIEKMEESGEVGIYLEDGEVKAVNSD